MGKLEENMLRHYVGEMLNRDGNGVFRGGDGPRKKGEIPLTLCEGIADDDFVRIFEDNYRIDGMVLESSFVSNKHGRIVFRDDEHHFHVHFYGNGEMVEVKTYRTPLPFVN